MLDKQGRITLFKELVCDGLEQLHIYYSVEENLFYTRVDTGNEISKEDFYLTTRKMDEKHRIHLPNRVRTLYQSKDVFIVKKNERLYFVPFNESTGFLVKKKDIIYFIPVKKD